MATRVAWVLNLDADLELGARGNYASSARTLLAMAPHVERLRTSLLGPEDVIVDEGAPRGAATGLPGRAFCPTPRAIALLATAGAIPEPHPPVEVLRRVNSRAFASSLGATLPGAVFVESLDGARVVLASAPARASAWRVKHAFGMAGRNQRVIATWPVDRDDEVFLRAGLARGGLQIEPHVAIDEELALHGVLAVNGSLRVGGIVRQRCDSRGAWLSTERVDHRALSPRAVADLLHEEVRSVALALCEAGYFGPFGVDAYSYRDDIGSTYFQPRSEINARYSMGFAVGFRDAL
jgi:hypothetical protein